MSRSYTCTYSSDYFLYTHFRELNSTELVQCQVEMLRMWGVLLRYGLCTSVYTQLYSILVKELHLGGQRSVRLTTALLGELLNTIS